MFNVYVAGGGRGQAVVDWWCRRVVDQTRVGEGVGVNGGKGCCSLQAVSLTLTL